MKVVWTSIDLRFFAVYASNTPHQTRSLEGFIDCLYERLNFAVDGGWAQWGPWTSCSPLCGHPSKKKRYRGCHDPAPQFGGKNCRGQKPDQENQEESMECKHNPPCPDAIRSSWLTLRPSYCQTESLITEWQFLVYTHHYYLHCHLLNKLLTLQCRI